MSGAAIMSSNPPDPPEHFGALPFEPQIRTKYVRVTNHGDVPFTDRHDGVPVQIDPGKSDNLPLDMAAHFFGYSEGVSEDAMFRHVCKRQGWNTPGHLKPSETDSNKTIAQMLFSKIEIKPVVYKMVEEKVDTDESIPADPEPAKIDELPALPRRKRDS